MRDYGKVHVSFWTSDTTRGLSEDGRIMALYLLTSPHTTLAGVFRLPDGYVCEDLNWPLERVKQTLLELLNKGFANRCETTKWIWIKGFLKWNPPENPNQKKSATKIFDSVPENCVWKNDYFLTYGKLVGFSYLPKNIDNSSETVEQPFRNQEQEQEQEQEQDKKHMSDSHESDEPVSEKSKVDQKRKLQLAQAKEVFEYWKQKFNKTDQTKYTDERKNKILARLNDGYTVEQIKQAVDGCASSEYHTNSGHTDIELICRTGSKLESFIGKLNLPNQKNQPYARQYANNPDLPVAPADQVPNVVYDENGNPLFTKAVILDEPPYNPDILKGLKG